MLSPASVWAKAVVGFSLSPGPGWEPVVGRLGQGRRWSGLARTTTIRLAPPYCPVNTLLRCIGARSSVASITNWFAQVQLICSPVRARAITVSVVRITSIGPPACGPECQMGFSHRNLRGIAWLGPGPSSRSVSLAGSSGGQSFLPRQVASAAWGQGRHLGCSWSAGSSVSSAFNVNHQRVPRARCMVQANQGSVLPTTNSWGYL